MKIVLIGAGNLATHLGKALHAAGHDMVQVFSRTMQSAETLASLLDAEPLTDMAQVRDDADVYIFSVKDSALEQLISQLCGDDEKRCGEEQLFGKEKKVFLHTAGSMPMSVSGERRCIMACFIRCRHSRSSARWISASFLVL